MNRDFSICAPATTTTTNCRCVGMLLLSKLFFLLVIWILAIVDAVRAQVVANAGSSGNVPAMSIDITVGSTVTTDYASSWMADRFAFGFYEENDGFSVGIRLFASPSDTVVVWTARPDLKRFTKDAFLNFTDKGLFVTPEKDAEAFPLFSFSSTATSATMLGDGNFIVVNSNISSNQSCNTYSSCTSSAAGGAGQSYSSNSTSCIKMSTCSPSSDNIIWRSFDFPTDTILGSQALPCGYNLTSSADKTNHSIGQYILNLPCGGANLISYRLNSADKNWDTGFSSGDYRVLNLDGNGRLYLTSFGGNEMNLFGYKPDSTDTDMLYRATLDPDGIFRLYAHNLDTKESKVLNEIPYYKDKCQTKDICGVNSYCFLANSSAQCNCMPGFDYINPDSQFAGCRRNKTFPICSADPAAADTFSMEGVDNIVGMDEFAYGVIPTASEEECSEACLSDCNCDAASFIDLTCLKLKLPLSSGRKDINFQSVALIKMAGERLVASGQRRREILFASILISVAATISICIVLIAAFLGAYWFLFGRFREEWRKWELALTEEIAPRYFSYEELVKGYGESKEELGTGGHGTVFRAELPIGNHTVIVAVKELHGATAGEREFQAEMRLIGRVYHANVVRLLGFCHDGPIRLIVYELMSRGSLAEHIFENSSRPLPLKLREAILLHAARGLHYLHRECETKIIHRDIKPENILLAEDWTAKIADFGLAKLMNKKQTRAATRTLAAGTEGYIAPECEQAADETGEVEVTEKADVYSYGIVILETICGQKNTKANPLCELVQKSYKNNELSTLVEGVQVEDVLLEKLVKIGLLCVQKDPNQRPLMEDIVIMLEGYIDVPTVPLSL